MEPDGALGPAGRVIPENIITRAPTAELRENQTDQDSLPPYDVLDDILKCLVEGEMPSPRSSRAATTATPCARSSGCSTSPNTSAARRRPASR